MGLWHQFLVPLDLSNLGLDLEGLALLQGDFGLVHAYAPGIGVFAFNIPRVAVTDAVVAIDIYRSSTHGLCCDRRVAFFVVDRDMPAGSVISFVITCHVAAYSIYSSALDNDVTTCCFSLASFVIIVSGTDARSAAVIAVGLNLSNASVCFDSTAVYGDCPGVCIDSAADTSSVSSAGSIDYSIIDRDAVSAPVFTAADTRSIFSACSRDFAAVYDDCAS